MPQTTNVLMPSSLREATVPVYHYTSSHGLLGLVQTGCVWASEATSLNDLAEVRHGWDVVKGWLGQQHPSEAVDLLSQMADDPFEKKHEVFVLSGSTARDDANQWRLFAQGGTGYAIELDPQVDLAAISDAPKTKRSLKSSDGKRTPNIGWYLGESATVTPWYHVLYTEDEVAAALRELLTATDRELPRLKDAKDDEEYAELRDVLYGQALEALGTIAYLVKGAGFSGEREVRVVATFMLANQHIRYRQGPHGIVSYGLLTHAPKGHPPQRVLHWPTKVQDKRPGKPLPIRSVRLGPLLNKEHVSTVRRLLVSNGVTSAPVKRSKVKLR